MGLGLVRCAESSELVENVGWMNEREREIICMLKFNKTWNKTIEFSKHLFKQNRDLKFIGQSWNEAFSSLLFSLLFVSLLRIDVRILTPNQTEVFLDFET